MTARRGWIVPLAAIAFALAVLAVGVGIYWVDHPQHSRGVPMTHHGDAFGKALVSGQLLLGNDPHESEPLGTGSITLANIYQVGPPVGTTTDVWSDGGFSMYVEPGSYTVFGLSPEYRNGTKACTPYDVPNGTISVRAGDRINLALLCR
jgi:hypothetical protein